MQISRLGILPFVLLFFVSLLCCTADDRTRTKHESKQQHTYDASQQPPQTINNRPSNTSFEEHGETRSLWQRPQLVINRLGNLSGKVLADIGAGPYGYFALRIVGQTDVKRVVAVDIDQEALTFIQKANKTYIPKEKQDRLDTRLATENDPKLKPGEADVVLIVNTCAYFADRVNYFKNLRKGLSKNGRLVIVDYKKKNTPGPAMENRVALGQIEVELLEAGYKLSSSDDSSLDIQYIVTAINEG